MIQRMTEEESGAWGCVDNGDVIPEIDRSTNQSRRYQAVYLVGRSMLTLDSWLRLLANPLRCPPFFFLLSFTLLRRDHKRDLIG